MRVIQIVEEYLKSNGFDGLCNCDVPCGCLLDNLCPCGDLNVDCQAGHREEVGSSVECGCDGQGENHWHVSIANKTSVVPIPMPRLQWLDGAQNWVCECGKRCDPSSSEWRWNGMQWEHHHGYPMGHVVATREQQEPS